MAFRSLFSLFSSDLAIDLGTANTCVYARGRGIVVNEPSIVAINKLNGKVEAVGNAAKDMLGRTPGNIVAIKPMKDGVIADFEITEKMLTHFIKQAHNGAMWVRPRIVIGVPSEITQVEKRAVKDSAYRAKASEVYLVEEAMASAIGAGMPITEPTGNMIVDIGGGTTEVAVISLSGVVFSKSAMTPSLSGRMAMMLPGVRPSIRLASAPTASTRRPLRLSFCIATTDGSLQTIPSPFR